ncbi:MAG TPA: hypothetical protein VML55_17630, partial [Planctomycetaceae bacterium]|nr:hypothetical protein [Planctomycetaceae bacterium]
MGYTLTPIAVDLARVRAAIGSQDRKLLGSLLRRFSDEFEEVDALARDLDDDSEAVEEISDGPEGLAQFAKSFRDGLAPLRQAMADAIPQPERAGPSSEAAPIAATMRPAPKPPANPGADQDDDADDEIIDATLPPELNTSKKLGAALEDALFRMFRGEEVPPEHPLGQVLAGEPEPDQDADQPGGPQPLMADVLRHLIMGEPYDPRVGFKYGYALEHLCQHFGEMLSNEHWSSFRSGASWGWFRKLDRTLKSLAVPEKTFRVRTHLENRGSPIPIPEIEDFPAIGYLTLDEIREAAAALEQADLASIRDSD